MKTKEKETQPLERDGMLEKGAFTSLQTFLLSKSTGLQAARNAGSRPTNI